MRIELLGASVLLVVTAGLASSQQPTSSNFVFPGGMGNTGVFRIPAETGELQVQVELLVAGESRSSARRCDPVWTVRDPSVLALVRTDPHYGAWVRPVSEGITELRAAFSCAPTLNLSVPVVVGTAAIERPFAATGDARNFYPATLKVQPAGSVNISAGKAIIGLDDKSVQFVATAHNPSGSLINADHFPMKWSVSNPGVLSIEKTYDHTAFFNAVGAGTTTVTASVEGISQSFEVTVQQGAPNGGEATELVTRTVKGAPSTGVFSGTLASGGVAQKAVARPREATDIKNAAGSLETPRVINASPLTVTGSAIQSLNRTLTSSSVDVVGLAIQALQRTITTVPLEVQGQQ